MATTNPMSAIGTGESLSGKIQNNFASVIAREQGLEGARGRARAARQKQSLDDYKKYLDDIKVDASKVHRLDQSNYRADAADVVHQLDRLVADHPDNWENLAGDIIEKAKVMNGEYAVRKAKLDKDEAMMMQAEEKGWGDANTIKKVRQAYQTGTAADLENIQDQYGDIKTGRDDKGRIETNINILPKSDLNEIVKKFDQHSVPTQDPSKIKLVPIGKLGDKIVGSKYTPFEISEQDVKQAADNILGNPVNLENYKRYYRPYSDYKNPNFDSKNEADRIGAQQDEITRWVRNNMAAKTPLVTNETWSPPISEKKKQWTASGNSYQDGTNIWHYDRNDEGHETYTFSKKNPAENAPMEFKGGEKGEIAVKGIPTRIEIRNGNPVIYVTTKEKVPIAGEFDAQGNPKTEVVEKEVGVKYLPYNASKIENEYGKNPYQVRQAVTGTTVPEKGGMTSSVKDGGKPSDGFQEFTVKGKKYRIPDKDVDEFKKDMGL